MLQSHVYEINCVQDEGSDLIPLQTSHVGNALSKEACLDEGFAGLVVDLFANGKLIPPLYQVHFSVVAYLCTASIA